MKVITKIFFYIFTMAPVFFFSLYSLSPAEQISGLKQFGTVLDLGIYAEIFSDFEILSSLQQTLILSATSSFFGVFLALITVHVLFFYKSNFVNYLLDISIFTWLVPSVVFAFPVYILLDTIVLYDTFVGLVLMHTAVVFTMACLFLIFIYSRTEQRLYELIYIEKHPVDLALWRIFWPSLIKIVVGLLCLGFILVWNDLLYAMFLTERNVEPYSLELVRSTTGTRLDWRKLAALGTLALSPIALGLFSFSGFYIFKLFYPKRRLGGVHVAY